MTILNATFSQQLFFGYFFVICVCIFNLVFWDNFRLGEQLQRDQTVTHLTWLPTTLTTQRNTTRVTVRTHTTFAFTSLPPTSDRGQSCAPSAFSRQVSSASSGLWQFPWACLVFHDLGNFWRLPVRYRLSYTDPVLYNLVKITDWSQEFLFVLQSLCYSK